MRSFHDFPAQLLRGLHLLRDYLLGTCSYAPTFTHLHTWTFVCVSALPGSFTAWCRWPSRWRFWGTWKNWQAGCAFQSFTSSVASLATWPQPSSCPTEQRWLSVCDILTLCKILQDLINLMCQRFLFMWSGYNGVWRLVCFLNRVRMPLVCF